MTRRLKFKKGYQKKLIKTTKDLRMLSWNELGKILAVSPNYLKKDLFHERRLLSEEVYKRICNIVQIDFDKYIIKRLNKNWGMVKGGKKSKPKQKETKLLAQKQSKELAEIIGIMLGDGNIFEKKGFYYVRICGHSDSDKEYLLGYVTPLIKKIFNIEMDIYQHKTNKEIYLTKGSKNLVFTLKNYGLKPGNKIKNNSHIPLWIFQSKDYLKACIRGLIDTDGSVVPITNRNYSYIWFSSQNPLLRKDFDHAMSILEYRTSNWSFHKTPELYIGSKEQIRKYYKEIGFNNPKHKKRFKCPGSVVRSI